APFTARAGTEHCVHVPSSDDGERDGEVRDPRRAPPEFMGVAKFVEAFLVMEPFRNRLIVDRHECSLRRAPRRRPGDDAGTVPQAPEQAAAAQWFIIRPLTVRVPVMSRPDAELAGDP